MPERAAGSIGTSKLAFNLRIPMVYLVAFATVLQVIGYALVATLPSEKRVPKAVNAYLFLAGLGGGIVIQGVLMAIPYTTEQRDNGRLTLQNTHSLCCHNLFTALALGTANQFRAMGSAVFISIGTSIFNHHIVSKLEEFGIDDPTPLVKEPVLAR